MGMFIFRGWDCRWKKSSHFREWCESHFDPHDIIQQTGPLTTWHMSPCLSTMKSPTVHFFSVFFVFNLVQSCSTYVQIDSNSVYLCLSMFIFYSYLRSWSPADFQLTCTESTLGQESIFTICGPSENGGIWLRNVAISRGRWWYIDDKSRTWGESYDNWRFQTVFFCGGFKVQLELSGLDLFEAGT